MLLVYYLYHEHNNTLLLFLESGLIIIQNLQHLLYNMVYELFHHIDNTEAVITRRDLLQTTCSAYNAEIYPALLSRYETTKKFIVNKSYCITHHCNVYVARNRAVKMINHQRIAEFFNPDLKDKENLAILHELGIDISIATLKRFRRDHGYVKNKKHKKAHTTPAVDERLATVDAEHTLPVPNVVSASAIPPAGLMPTILPVAS